MFILAFPSVLLVSCTLLSLWWFGFKHNFWTRRNRNVPRLSVRVDSLEPHLINVCIRLWNWADGWMIVLSISIATTRLWWCWILLCKLSSYSVSLRIPVFIDTLKFTVSWIRQLSYLRFRGRSNFTNRSNPLTRYQARNGVGLEGCTKLAIWSVLGHYLLISAPPFWRLLMKSRCIRTLKIWGLIAWILIGLKWVL